MLESLINFTSVIDSAITIKTFLICTAVSLVLGVLTALVYMFINRCSRSFAVTLALLPAVVQTVIMLVNGNIGAGVAVAGAFSLVRFAPRRERQAKSARYSSPWQSVSQREWAMLLSLSSSL